MGIKNELGFDMSVTERKRKLLLAAVLRYQATPKGRANKRKHQLKLYGITPDEWDEMFLQQSGQCAICKTAHAGRSGWNTDHCHVSSKVRGILCWSCNTILGLAKDDSMRLRLAADYLERNKHGS